MMNKFLKALAVFVLAFSSEAYAQNNYIRNDTPTTLYGTNLMIGNRVAVDQYGRMQFVSVGGAGGGAQSIIPISNATSLNGIGSGVVGWQRMGADTAETTSTATVIKATAHIGRVGDAVMFTGGTAANLQVWSTISAVTTDTFTLLNALPATPANGDAFNFLRPVAIGAGPAGSAWQPSLSTNIDANTQLSTTTGILKQEDNAASSGDAAVAALVQRADTEGDTTNTDGDYATLHETDGRLSTILRDRTGVTNIDTSQSNAAVTVTADGYAQICFSWQSGAATGTGAFEITTDGTNWVAAEAFQPRAIDASYTLAGTANLASTSNYCVPSASSILKARLRVSVTGSGTLPVTYLAKAATNMQRIFWVNPGTTAGALGKAEDAAHASGDVGVMSLGVRNTALTSLTSTDGDYSPIAVNTNGGILADIQWGMQQNTGLGLLKKEDAASADAEVGVAIMGVRDDTGAVKTSNDGDYENFSLTSRGAVLGDLRFGWASSGADSIMKVEDRAAADGDTAVGALFVREDALTANTGTSGDWTWGKTDSSGRLITTMAPMGESFQSCGTATAVTSDVAIKAAVASNRMYVTSITCKNTSATVGTTLDFKDGSTIIATGGITSVQATAPGSFTATFPVPLRGSVNTALNFATNVAVSSATCCAHGYVSTQ